MSLLHLTLSARSCHILILITSHKMWNLPILFKEAIVIYKIESWNLSRIIDHDTSTVYILVWRNEFVFVSLLLFYVKSHKYSRKLAFRPVSNRFLFYLSSEYFIEISIQMCVKLHSYLPFNLYINFHKMDIDFIANYLKSLRDLRSRWEYIPFSSFTFFLWHRLFSDSPSWDYFKRMIPTRG